MRAALFLAASLCFAGAASAQVERLDVGHEPLVRDFRASKGRAKLVAILSPT
jgi:hypothetical protein